MEFFGLSFMVGTGAAVATYLVVRLWIVISWRAKILDRPTARSSHVRATPRGGGVGIVITFVVAVAIVSGWGSGVTWEWLCALMVAVMVACVSFVDDIRSLPSSFRLLVHVVAATGVVILLPVPWLRADVPYVGTVVLPLFVGQAIAVMWVVCVTNMYNFMDGIDGIAGGQGAIAGFGWMAFGVLVGDQAVYWCGLILGSGCVGFLALNWQPARVFMGDVGSAFLGFCFGAFPLLALHRKHETEATQTGAVAIFAALALWPFMADGTITLLRRLRHRENIFEAHRSHLYQRLTVVGWSHFAVSLLYLGWAIACAGAGLICVAGRGLWQAPAVCFAALSPFALVALVTQQERRRAQKGTDALSDAAVVTDSDPARESGRCVRFADDARDAVSVRASRH